MPESVFDSRIEDLVRREWKVSKEEGDSARPRSLPGSLYASECECQRGGTITSARSTVIAAEVVVSH